jgi:hypothetical protein
LISGGIASRRKHLFQAKGNPSEPGSKEDGDGTQREAPGAKVNVSAEREPGGQENQEQVRQKQGGLDQSFGLGLGASAREGTLERSRVICLWRLGIRPWWVAVV